MGLAPPRCGSVAVGVPSRAGRPGAVRVDMLGVLLGGVGRAAVVQTGCAGGPGTTLGAREPGGGTVASHLPGGCLLPGAHTSSTRYEAVALHMTCAKYH